MFIQHRDCSNRARMTLCPRASRAVHAALLAVGLLVSAPLMSAPAHAADSRGISFLIVDLRTGATLASERPDIADRPILPGSVMKIAAIAAAMESGTIDERTRIVCTRSVVVDGHRLTCTHPDLHRALTPAEALTHSCDVYVATIAARLPRAAFDRALAGLGLPPSSAAASEQASALGLEGSRVPARALMNAVVRIANQTSLLPWKPATLDVVRLGLRNAAHDGTASALGAAGIDALAKTGTVDAGGVSQGLVVGVTPSSNPTMGFALIASGGAGRDAASLIAPRLRSVSTTDAAAGRRSSGSSPSPGAATGQGQRVDAVKPTPASVTKGEVIRIGVAQPKGGYVVKTMSLDDYVAGVVTAEAASVSGPAALDAMAIAVRTYTLANRERHAADGFDLCDLTHCQVFRAANRASRDASVRTAGRYLSDRGAPAHIFYTGSCGGFSERAPNVWRGASDPTYLPSKADPACVGESAWHDEISARDVLRALKAGGFTGDSLRGLSVSQRSASGRVAWLRVDGLSPNQVSGDNLRMLVGRTLGWQHLRSTLFDVARTDTGFAFSGTGAGHGVGLCVVGAAARAREGSTAEDILRNYFPGLAFQKLTTVDSPKSAARDQMDGTSGLQSGEQRRADMTAGPTRLSTSSDSSPTVQLRISLPQQDEPLRGDAMVSASLALRQVRAALDVTTDTLPVALRFHPTVESYQRATGLPWYTAGATHERTIELLPFGVLRQRGLLESTLRHEFAHALTNERLQGAPLWMHEGVAVWASRGPSAAAQTPAGPVPAAMKCPSDAELTKASSGEAIQRLYEQAAQCYGRELAAGRSWRAWVNSPW